MFERLIEPFCSGVYAVRAAACCTQPGQRCTAHATLIALDAWHAVQGDPAKLSMKAAFGKVWKLEDQGGSIIGMVHARCSEWVQSSL